jgi:hypothetical protein
MNSEASDRTNTASTYGKHPALSLHALRGGLLSLAGWSPGGMARYYCGSRWWEPQTFLDGPSLLKSRRPPTGQERTKPRRLCTILNTGNDSHQK